MNTPSGTTPQETEKQRNQRLYGWFSDIVARFDRADIKAAWIREIDADDNDTGEILAGRVPADEYKTIDIDADQYLKLSAVARYCGMTDKERKQHDSVHETRPAGYRKINRKSAKKR